MSYADFASICQTRRVIVAATDGSSLSNPGPAGWAWYIDEESWGAGGWPEATNNRAELTAVLDLLNQTAGTEEPVHILADSQYVINSLTKWIHNWKRNGWRTSNKKPVENRDLMEALDSALAGRKVTFEWVKGHAGHSLNEAADAKATAVAAAYQAGTTPNCGPGFGADVADSANIPVVKPSIPARVEPVQDSLF